MGYLGKEHRSIGTKAQWSGGGTTVVEFLDTLRS
jgi:hypothetical protein